LAPSVEQVAPAAASKPNGQAGEKVVRLRTADADGTSEGESAEIEISVAIWDEIVSWRHIFNRAGPANARDLLRRAAAALFRVLLVNKLERPETDGVAHQAVVDFLDEMAKLHGIDPDDAQAMFAQAKAALPDKSPNGGGYDEADNAALDQIALQLDALPHQGALSEPASSRRVAIMVRGDKVALKSIKWSWKHRFAFGKLALIAGDPGLGKSQIALDIAARHTTGELWPVDGGHAPLCEVIVLTAEDGMNDTAAPRLVAAGADMSKIHFLRGTKVVGSRDEELFDLTRDVAVLRDELNRNPNIKVIVIDPLTAYLGETQAQRNTQVRRALAPLVRLIEETGVLIIAINHLNKSQGKAIYRVLDSIAFVALGRILHRVVEDAENPANRKFVCGKTNIGPKPAGLTFICQLTPVITEDGEDHISRISWGTQHINESADQALLEAETGPAKDEAGDGLSAAVEFLRIELGPEATKDTGGRVESKIIEDAARRAGISPRTLDRARYKLKVVSEREGFGANGKFYLRLPVHRTPSDP